ncbi:hypothetical protein QUF96_03110 [Bacillus bombysepticus]|nr:hypothetical protein [Bacillus bombysepticus]
MIPYALVSIVAIAFLVWLSMFAYLMYVAIKETKEMEYRMNQWLNKQY